MELVIAALRDVHQRARRRWTPCPSIVKRLNACIRARTCGGFEQDDIAGVGIERRIKIDQINAFILQMLAQNIKVVTIIERVGHHQLLASASAERKA